MFLLRESLDHTQDKYKTTTDEEHYHTFKVDSEGNGSTIHTFNEVPQSDVADHVHKITNNVIEEKQDHIHRFKNA
jgi:hypothetical protein